MSRYRFALRPKWLLSHLLVAALVVTMVNLGFWQLQRLSDKRARNDLVSEQAERPVVDVAEVLTLSLIHI